MEVNNNQIYSLELLIPFVKLMMCLWWVQPHGFFNCSPAVDVPPGACELDVKDADVKDSGGVVKPIPNGLMAKL